MSQILLEMKTDLFPHLEPQEAEWIERQLSAYLSLEFEVSPCLLHSDFSSDHIFYDEDARALSGVIDFADTEIADPAFDFSGLWIYGAEFVSQVHGAYNLPTGGDFLARSKLPFQVHSAVNAMRIMQGRSNPRPLDHHLRLLRKEMAYFGGP